jgi:hypothetical protein
MWVRTLFNHEREYDQRTNSTKMQTSGTLGTEDVYEMPFNEKNLKELASLRENDADIAVTVKDEAADKVVEVDFQKPFDYLLKAEYFSPQQRAELRQMAIDAGIIAPGTTFVAEDKTPPTGTYS